MASKSLTQFIKEHRPDIDKAIAHALREEMRQAEKEIKATGSGRPDTMSRVINPPNNGL